MCVRAEPSHDPDHALPGAVHFAWFDFVRLPMIPAAPSEPALITPYPLLSQPPTRPPGEKGNEETKTAPRLFRQTSPSSPGRGEGGREKRAGVMRAAHGASRPLVSDLALS